MLDGARLAFREVIRVLTEFGAFTDMLFGVNLFNEFRDFWNGVANFALSAFRRIIEFARTTFDAIRDPLSEFAEFIGIGDGDPETVAEIQGEISKLRNLIVGAEANRGFSDASRSRVINAYRAEIAELESQLRSVQAAANGVGGALDGLSMLSIDNVLPESVDITLNPQINAMGIREGADALAETFDAATANLSIGDRIAQAIDDIGRSPEEKARARERFEAIGEVAAETFGQLQLPVPEIPDIETGWDIEMQGVVNSTERAADQIDRRLSDTARTIGDAFGNFAGSLITDFRNIGDAARRLGQQIIEALTQRFVVNPISNFVGNLLGGIFPGLQDGGVGRGLTLVGEAGPEVVDFRRPGRVYSNDQLRDAIIGRAGNISGGGQPVVVNVTVNSADSGAVTRAISDALPAIIETVKGVVGVEASRPSALNSQLQRAF